MKKSYFNLVLVVSVLFVLTSCTTRYKFKTQGLTETDSSYLLTKTGKRIYADDIAVRPSGVKVDKQKYPLDELVGIKSKKMYFVVNDGEIYMAEVYGKINLLYTLSTFHSSGTGSFAGAGNGMGPGTPSQTTVSKNYYLQKGGSTELNRLTRATLLEYVGDNEEALSLAKAHYVWRYSTFIPTAAFVVGAALFVKSFNSDKSNAYVPPFALMGASALGVGILGGISNHKLHKAIVVYNQ